MISLIVLMLSIQLLRYLFEQDCLSIEARPHTNRIYGWAQSLYGSFADRIFEVRTAGRRIGSAVWTLHTPACRRRPKGCSQV